MSSAAQPLSIDVQGGLKSPSPDAVLAHLERVIASSAFETSERNRRFLRHVVEETLAGRAERIKAYSIATSVFEREKDFDPQIDPIVRIEAGRLRRALEHYYLTAGKEDSVRIEIPKGTYIPRFKNIAGVDLPASPPDHTPPRAVAGDKPKGISVSRWRRLWPLRLCPPSVGAALAALAIVAAASLQWAWLGYYSPFPASDARKLLARRGPALFVMQFDATDSASATLGQGFTRDVIAGLTRFRDLFVFGPDTSFGYKDPSDHRQLSAALGVDYVLSGSVSAAADRLRVTAVLVDARTDRHVWSERFEAQPTAVDLFRIQDEIANRLVRALADPYGALFRQKAQEIAGKPPRQLISYECVVRYRLFWRQFDPQQIEPVRECLERAVRADPDYADAHAALALITLDAVRIGTVPQPNQQAQFDRALHLAERAVALAPDAAYGYQALHHIHWLRGDLENSFAAAERAVALNPNNSEALAELGMRRAMRGDWGKGLPLLEEAYARNPLQSGAGRQLIALHRYVQGRYADALAEAQRIELPHFVYTHVLLAMAHARLGHRSEADTAVKRILEINPRFAEVMIADLEGRHLHPDLIRVIADGLKEAGLEIKRPAQSPVSLM